MVGVLEDVLTSCAGVVVGFSTWSMSRFWDAVKHWDIDEWQITKIK